MNKPASVDNRSAKRRQLKKLAGRGIIAGAIYAGRRLRNPPTKKIGRKKSQTIRNLVGLAVVAGAIYGLRKISSRRKKL